MPLRRQVQAVWRADRVALAHGAGRHNHGVGGDESIRVLGRPYPHGHRLIEMILGIYIIVPARRLEARDQPQGDVDQTRQHPYDTQADESVFESGHGAPPLSMLLAQNTMEPRVAHFAGKFVEYRWPVARVGLSNHMNLSEYDRKQLTVLFYIVIHGHTREYLYKVDHIVENNNQMPVQQHFRVSIPQYLEVSSQSR